MQNISLEERQSLESKAKFFIQSIGASENSISSLMNLLESLHSELHAKVERSEIKEILLEMRQGFEAMDKRFEDTQRQMDKRFEAMDKRFEELQKQMDKRFEQMDKRFEQVDKRFEDMQKQMDKRFEQVDKRFEDMNKRFTILTWFVSLAFLAMPGIITLILKLNF